MKNKLLNLLLFLVTTFTMLAVCEGLVRWSGIAYEPQYDSKTRITQRSPDPILHSELIPGFDGEALGAHVHINSFGFRGPEVTQEKPDSVTRIALIGDSWAFGWGVDQDQVMAPVLENFLNDAGDETYEVLNFSRPGYSLQQEEIVLRDKAIAFGPDIVIFAFNINDLDDLKLDRSPTPEQSSTEEAGAEPFKSRLWKTLFRWELIGNTNSHLFRLLDRSLRWVAMGLIGSDMGKSAYFNKFYAEDSPELLFMKESYTRIHELADKNDFQLWVVYCPWMADLTPQNPYRETFSSVATIAREHGFQTLDLFPSFMGKDVGKLRISMIDGHPTSLGHQIAAEVIAESILSDTGNPVNTSLQK